MKQNLKQKRLSILTAMTLALLLSVVIIKKAKAEEHPPERSVQVTCVDADGNVTYGLLCVAGPGGCINNAGCTPAGL